MKIKNKLIALLALALPVFGVVVWSARSGFERTEEANASSVPPPRPPRACKRT
ncbi:MAG: hypothetical protein U0235_30970 [Polyangiaceae bacterium]